MILGMKRLLYLCLQIQSSPDKACIRTCPSEAGKAG